jgi:FMN phosphatase YigB (HAD superfamily)
MSPSTILVIGDRDDTDGIAASNAGMAFLRISNKKSNMGGAHDWPAIKAYLINHFSL